MFQLNKKILIPFLLIAVSLFTLVILWSNSLLSEDYNYRVYLLSIHILGLLFCVYYLTRKIVVLDDCLIIYTMFGKKKYSFNKVTIHLNGYHGKLFKVGDISVGEKNKRKQILLFTDRKTFNEFYYNNLKRRYYEYHRTIK